MEALHLATVGHTKHIQKALELYTSLGLGLQSESKVFFFH